MRRTNFRRDFERWWRAFGRATSQTYPKISLAVTSILHGPDLPEHAFINIEQLRNWYKVVLSCWLRDAFEPSEIWRGKLPTQDHELALLRVQLEAKIAGVRRIQRRLFRDRDGVPREFPIETYEELIRWCDFLFEVLADDEQHVDEERHTLTFRYDKGVQYRLNEEHKDHAKNEDPWVAAMVHKMMKAVARGKPHKVEPDDEWILVIWTGLADADQLVREVSVSLFVEAVSARKQPDVRVLDGIISSTWQAMRRLGTVCSPEPNVTRIKDARRALDAVRRWAERHKTSHEVSPEPRRKIHHAPARRKTQTGTAYDVYLAHNSKERVTINAIALKLRRRGLKPWLDREQIQPGRWFQDVLQKGIRKCKAAVVFIGPSGFGRWQTLELRTFLSRCVEDNIPIIPVLLPGAKEIPSEFLFLKELQLVEFNDSIDDADALDNLVWGITGKYPR